MANSMKAEVVKVYDEGGLICMEVRVDEGDRDENGGTVHHVYTGRVPNDATFAKLTEAQQKTLLIAACSAVRDAERNPGKTTLPNISGAVSL